MEILRWIIVGGLLAAILVLVGILLYDQLAGRKGRYVAEDLNYRPILNVPTGVVNDTTPEQPSTLDRTGPGFEHVTTLSNARSIARWANRNEGKS